MNYNNDNFKMSDKKSDFVVLKIIYPLIGLLIVILNPLSIFGIALLVSVPFYFIIFKSDSGKRTFLFLTGGLYVLFLLMYSVSPKVQYLEFKFSHYNWIEVDGRITDFSIDWKSGKNRKSIADIKYQFKSNDHTYKREETGAVVHYTNSIFWDSEKDKMRSNAILESDVKDYINEKNYRILYHPKTRKSKIMMPLNMFLFSNSGGFNIIFTTSKIFLIPLLLMFIIFGNTFKRK